MEIIIYGKDHCNNCDKARMLCQIQSIPFQYHKIGTDISVEMLQEKLSQPLRSLPQIFIRADGNDTHVGSYEALRQTLLAGLQREAKVGASCAAGTQVT